MNSLYHCPKRHKMSSKEINTVTFSLASGLLIMDKVKLQFSYNTMSLLFEDNLPICQHISSNFLKFVILCDWVVCIEAWGDFSINLLIFYCYYFTKFSKNLHVLKHLWLSYIIICLNADLFFYRLKIVKCSWDSILFYLDMSSNIYINRTLSIW